MMVIIHMLMLMLMYALMAADIVKIDSHMLVVVICIPFFGAFCALMITAIALYDILTPGGDLNGLFGTVLLIVFIPVSVVLLIGDVVVWQSNRRRSQETDSR